MTSLVAFAQKFNLCGDKYILCLNKNEFEVFFKYKKENKETTEYVVNIEDITIVEHIVDFKNNADVELKIDSDKLSGKILGIYGRNEVYVIHILVKN